MVVAPAERTRTVVTRNFMPDVSPHKLSAFRSRSEQQLINGFLAQQHLQVYTQARDLTQADMILRQLRGKPVNESTSDEKMSCLVRCFHHFEGYMPLV
jgi:hypothetical protein